MKEAILWKKENLKVRCNLCARRCLIEKNKLGFCKVRKNINGKLFSLNYGKLIAVNVDPIEKKPFYHFLPGSSAISIASAGCNFACEFCFLPENWVIVDGVPKRIDEIFAIDGKEIKHKNGKVKLLNSNHKVITGKGENGKIEKVYKHSYDGKIKIIKPYYLPALKCTPAHKFLVLDKLSKKIHEVRARDLSKHDMLLLPKIWKNNNDFIQEIDLVKILKRKEKMFFKIKRKFDWPKIKRIIKLKQKGFTSTQIAKIFNTNQAYIRTLLSRHLYRNKKIQSKGLIDLNWDDKYVWFKLEKKEKIKRRIKLDKEFGFLLGLFCSEGYVVRRKNRPNSYSLSFTFNKKEKELAEFVISKIRESFGIKCNLKKYGNILRVSSSKNSLALFFKLCCGENSYCMSVPEFIFKSEPKVIFGFLKGLLKGDGYECNEYIEFVTTSEKLAFQIFYLLIRLGFLPSFHRIAKENIFETFRIRLNKYYKDFFYGEKIANPVKIKPARFVDLGDFIAVNIRKIEEKYYRGEVYNLEVSTSDHSYLCNFVAVKNCCNWQISQIYHNGQKEVVGENYEPEQIVNLALENNCKSISYTYTEPTIFFEFAYDVGKIARKRGLKNNFVTNGYLTEEAINEAKKFLDAAVVDLKACLDAKFYLKVMKVPKTDPILDCIKIMNEKKIHVEITNLIIPKIGDNEEKFKNLVDWVVNEVSAEIPFHVLRFFPNYRLKQISQTPLETLEKFIEIAKNAGLKYVYIGNVWGHENENTFCPNCGEILIKRYGFYVTDIKIKNGKCFNCNEKINIVI